MNNIIVSPGKVVVTDFGAYQHWSIVSDRICSLGQYMLISASKREGTVQEEAWDIVTQGKRTYVAEFQYAKPVSDVLRDARQQIGEWAYSLMNRNCEHFIKHITGFEVTSSQVKAGVVGAAAGVSMVALASKSPTVMKFLTAGIVVGGLALLATKMAEEVNDEPNRI